MTLTQSITLRYSPDAYDAGGAMGYACICAAGGTGRDHRAGFAAYEERMKPFLKRKQESARKCWLHVCAKSAGGLILRVALRLLRFPARANYLVGRDLPDDIKVPDYRWI